VSDLVEEKRSKGALQQSQCSIKSLFPDSAKAVLVLQLHLGAEGQGDEQGFFCGADRIELDAYKLFWPSRVACIWWRPDGDHRHSRAEEPVIS
jgi:hypothetical protein